MKPLEVSCAVRPIYGSLGAKGLKNSVWIFVETIYKMGCLEGSGVPVLCIGRTVPKG
jgi:hypothetical protein